jgi:lipopolysaccharide biosynthesis glycosyltransferase
MEFNKHKNYGITCFGIGDILCSLNALENMAIERGDKIVLYSLNDKYKYRVEELSNKMNLNNLIIKYSLDTDEHIEYFSAFGVEVTWVKDWLKCWGITRNGSENMIKMKNLIDTRKNKIGVSFTVVSNPQKNPSKETITKIIENNIKAGKHVVYYGYKGDEADKWIREKFPNIEYEGYELSTTISSIQECEEFFGADSGMAWIAAFARVKTTIIVGKHFANPRTFGDMEWTKIVDEGQYNNNLKMKSIEELHLITGNPVSIKQYDSKQYNGKGIVTCSGGIRYLLNTFVGISLIRKYGCELPIEIWHIGQHELDNYLAKMFNELNVTFIDACKFDGYNNIGGWSLKPFSIINSSFKEIIFIDSDCMPCCDISNLFYNKDYINFGSLFFRDCQNLSNPKVYELLGIDNNDEREFESGQIVINKEKCWKELNVTLWFNINRNFWYSIMYGDKDTFRLSWKLCKTEYGVNDKFPIRTLNSLNHYINDTLTFHHRCGDKLNFFNNQSNGCPSWDDVINYIRKIRVKSMKSNITEGNKEIFNYLTSNVWDYSRIGRDSRMITFNSDGTIQYGAARMERFWTLVEDILSIYDENDEETLVAKYDISTKSFFGKWSRFEKMDISIIKKEFNFCIDYPFSRKIKYDLSYISKVEYGNLDNTISDITAGFLCGNITRNDNSVLNSVFGISDMSKKSKNLYITWKSGVVSRYVEGEIIVEPKENIAICFTPVGKHFREMCMYAVKSILLSRSYKGNIIIFTDEKDEFMREIENYCEIIVKDFDCYSTVNRIYAFEYISHTYKSILYLDCDIWVCGDVNRLFTFNDEVKYLEETWHKNSNTLSGDIDTYYFNKNEIEIEFGDMHPINTGHFSFSGKYKDVFANAYKETYESRSEFKYGQEQASFNYIIRKNKVKSSKYDEKIIGIATRIDPNCYNQFDLIHFAGVGDKLNIMKKLFKSYTYKKLINNMDWRSIDGCLSEEEIRDILEIIVKNNKNKIINILEIGTYHGRSSIALCLGLLNLGYDCNIDTCDVFNVDPNRKDGEIFAPNKEVVDETISKFELSSRIKTYKIINNDIENVIPINKKYDFIYIDGSHRYNDVISNCTTAKKLIKSSGVIFGDDYCDEWFGVEVKSAVHDYFGKDNIINPCGKQWVYNTNSV